jgi:hypothetical protein
MSLRHRPMRPKDVRECVRILAAHPILGPRYAEILEELPQVFLSLLGREGFQVTVFEEFHGDSHRILGGGTACFVGDEFMREPKTPPFFWGAPEIVRRLRRGDSPILSDKEVRQANSQRGLNLYVWHTGLSPEDLGRADVMHLAVSTFIEVHRGYQLKELLEQAETWEQFCGMRAAGGHFVRPSDGQYAEYLDAVEADVAKTPLMAGLTRELIQGYCGASWVSTLFKYEPPRLGLARSEQTLLQAALHGGTDEELSHELGISLSAVKKGWRTVYDRAAARLPELIRSETTTAAWKQERGTEKKQRVIAYLREHPEELRPISRKLLTPIGAGKQ